jgi:histidinol dehydrogenase
MSTVAANGSGMPVLYWNTLDAAAKTSALARPAQVRQAERTAAVARIIEQVRADGDNTLRALTRRFDGCEIADIAITDAEFAAADAWLPDDLRQAMADAAARIEAFHAPGAPQPYRVDTAAGVRCERIVRPIARVGLYVPAGTAPLPSTALMLGVPARLAGCADVVLCTPPRADGSVDPGVLAAAALCGIRQVFRLGGAQAIAAMAYGTESVPKCDKLFGPGNAWVTEAKLQVSTDADGAAIDLPAGPSEVLVIADAAADAEFVAADLLSQAEHGGDSQAILLTDCADLAACVAAEVATQAAQLARADTLAQALQHARILVVRDLAQAVEVSNRYAPEHLIIATDAARDLLGRVTAAGSVFLGRWAPEALGDYCSGTNHVLPTYGAARAYSGVSVASFQRLITVQEVDPAGLAAIGPCAVTLARAEQLEAHAQAVSRRLARLPESRA